ncbi:PREDICTED: uncharacterized protein LOC109231711 [Nicotiana attenuata]|uniref:uncharacterized protein LOC109231711 n=1 Tax=Nicotiana attenuata TaxID=49451 RepID=UPI0009056147|nr:PREDICTED: uncharacterized protein LOC109231711 [Nicotiana attenuata]
MVSEPAVYIINRVPSTVLGNKSPFELLYHRQLSQSHLRIIGCLCFASLLPKTDKFGPRTVKCVLLGYAALQKGYKLHDLEHNVYFISRDVTFFEDAFPFQNPKEGTDQSFLDDLNMRTLYDHSTADHEFPELSIPPVEVARKSSRTSKPPIWLKDYVTADKGTQSNSCRYPIAAVIGYDQLSPKYQSYLSQFSSEQEPNSYYEAAKDKRWIEAMQA